MNSKYKNILKNSNFMYLWVSQILSQLTISVMNFLLLTYLYTATGSTIATSFLWLAFALPALLIGPIGAALVDIVDRRKVLMITNLLQAATVALIIFIYKDTLFVIYFVVFVYSALNQFYVPAEAASLPSYVSRKMLSIANGLFFITMQVAVIVGFGFAGLLERLIGLNGALTLSAIFLFSAFVSVSFLPPGRPQRIESKGFEKDLKTFFEKIIEGYHFISKNKSILFPILILLSVQAGLAITMTILPGIAHEILNISVNYSGISIVVPAGIGALIGALYIPRLSRKVWRKKTIVELSLAITTVAFFTVSFGVAFLPLVARIIVTSVLIVLTGFAFVGVNIPTLTYLQENTPEWFRGRVFGNLWFLVTLTNVIPVIFSGAITEIFGVRTLFVVLGCCTLLMLFYSQKMGQRVIAEHFVTPVVKNKSA